jgi:hypothetical protein
MKAMSYHTAYKFHRPFQYISLSTIERHHLQSVQHFPHHQRNIKAAARDDGDIEVAVFRFTLGIPGFDDALIPRVVGILGAGLILANHLVSPQPVSGPQTRVEVLGAILAAVGIAAPTLQQRLEELRPGRGRRAAAESVPGGTNVFALDTENLSEGVQQNLAWSSYAILKNSNTCGMFVVNKGQVLMCRGILGSSIAANRASETLQRATDAWASVIQSNSDGGSAFQQQLPLILEDRGIFTKIPRLDTCKLIPSGANSVAIIPMQPFNVDEDKENNNRNSSLFNGECVVVLVSERERALSAKEIRWAQGVAAKLYSILP